MLLRLFAIPALAMLFAAPLAQAQAAPDAVSAPAPAAVPPSLTPAQKARLAPRRPTRQIVGSPLPIVTDGYRPTLTSRERASGTPDPVGNLPVHPTPAGANAVPVAPLPVPVSGCTAGSCTGADGVRYDTGASGVTVDRAGRTCHRVGTTVQCF
jgi:hypothetical protein